MKVTEREVITGEIHEHRSGFQFQFYIQAFIAAINLSLSNSGSSDLTSNFCDKN
jgi:hypothetical protein